MIEDNLPIFLSDTEFLNPEEVGTTLGYLETLPYMIHGSIGAAIDGVHGIKGDKFLDRLIVFSEPSWGLGVDESDHPLWPLAQQLTEKFCDKHGFRLIDIYRTRVNLTFSTKDPRPLIPHVDLRNRYQHYILLFFFNDSDGDTVLYDLQVDGDVHNQDDLVELKRFSPIAGAAAIFHGDYFHAWEAPLNHDYRASMIANIAVEKID